jgi:hypothetical protein
MCSSLNVIWVIKNEMGGTCSTYREIQTRFHMKTLKRRNHLGYPGIGNEKLKWILKIGLSEWIEFIAR